MLSRRSSDLDRHDRLDPNATIATALTIRAPRQPQVRRRVDRAHPAFTEQALDAVGLLHDLADELLAHARVTPVLRQLADP